MREAYKTLDILISVYAYGHALKIAEQIADFPPRTYYLIEMMKERRELNIDFLLAHPVLNRELETADACQLITNPPEEEQLANYIMDLEAKVKNGEIIDFVRAVSPILYRLFRRLVEKELPDLTDFIRNAKGAQYDTWQFHKMKDSQYPIFQAYLKVRRDAKVTSKSLAELLQFAQIPDRIKELILELRDFEKSVRNPLAHLIKPFDEAELYRTTHFSSQVFLDKIIELARFAGIFYNRERFYYDQVNSIIQKSLESS